MIPVSRQHDSWDGYIYSCDICGVDGQSIAALNHNRRCPVTSPDDISTTVHNDTVQLIQTIQREVRHRLEQNEQYVKDVANLSDINGVKWYTQGSAGRLVLGLGRTTDTGKLHLSEQRGIVIKYDPRIRRDEEYTPVSSNVDELFTWEEAIETNTRELFAEIIDYSLDGAWLAMEQCIPIYPSRRNVMKHRDAIYDRDRLNEYVSKLNDAGWEDPDWKHGNVGVTDEGDTVLLDYGTGPNFTL